MQLICPLISSFRPVLPCPSLLLGRPVWGCTDHITQHSQLHAGLTRCELLFIAAATRLLPALLRLRKEGRNRNETESNLCLLGFANSKKDEFI